MSAAADLATVLQARRTGLGWVARCPAHHDRTPSLSIRETDGGRLLLKCFAGCSWDDLRQALEARSLWPGREGRRPGCARTRATSPDGSCPGFLQADRLAAVTHIWRRARLAPRTEVEHYLRSRSLTMPVPPTLRCALLRHGESGRWLPCMVAAVQASDDRLVGLHRTYLQPHGDGKADVEPVKKMLGASRGGAVRLAAAGRRLALCEGIRDRA
jgi:hypothetical protein